MTTLCCETCGKSPAVVAASVMGPMSEAVCAECLAANRTSYDTCVAGLCGGDWDGGRVTPDQVTESVRTHVEASLQFAGKTWEQLADDVAQATADYLEAMRAENDAALAEAAAAEEELTKLRALAIAVRRALHAAGDLEADGMDRIDALDMMHGMVEIAMAEFDRTAPAPIYLDEPPFIADPSEEAAPVRAIVSAQVPDREPETKEKEEGSP